MIRLTAIVSGNVQRVGYRAKVVSLAKEMDLVGVALNQPDGRVLLIAESEKKDGLERFASAIMIKNALIHVDKMEVKYTQGSGQYSAFRKISGPDEVGERLDEGIEILKEMLTGIKGLTVGVNNLTAITTEGFEKLDGKMDQMLDKQDATIGEIQGLRDDLKGYMDKRFKHIEADLTELKEMKVALKEKGLI